MNQPLAYRSGTTTTRLVWLSATLCLCAALIALAVAVIGVVLPTQLRTEVAEGLVEHTNQVIIAIDDMLVTATVAETGARGFLLTEDAGFFESYDRGAQDIWRQFDIIRKLTADNATQQSGLMVLDGDLRARIAELSHAIGLARSGNIQAALDVVRSGRGEALMAAVRATATDMVAEERRLLLARRSELKNTQHVLNEILISLVIFGTLGMLASGGAGVWATLTTSAGRRFAASIAERLRLLNLLDRAPIMVRDLDGVVRFWSEGCHRLYGWTAEQAIGQPARALLQTAFPVSPNEIDADLRRKGEWSGELHSRKQNGARLIVFAHMFLDEHIDGRGLGVVETVTDITEPRRLEADVRTSEARLSLFMKNAPAAIAMFDNAMCYVGVSKRFLDDYRLDGQSRASLIGRCHYDVFPDIPDHWRAAHARALAGETQSSVAEPFVRSDGRIDWVRWEMSPWRHANGTIGGAFLFSEVVTERHEAETALRDNEARLRLVQDVGGIGFTDRTPPEPTTLISAELADIYGLPPGQQRILVADIIAVVHPDDRDRIAAVTPTALVREGVLATEFRICRPDGSVRWISMRAEAFVGPTGLPQRIISAQQDITETVAAREVLAARSKVLERSNADLEEFAYTVAHDLKAPLRAIGHLAQWIGEDIKDTVSPETTYNINLLHDRVGRMQKLLVGLLEYSRACQSDKTIENVAVADLVSNIVTMQAPPQGFVVTYEGERLILRTPLVALQVVLENLISNSLKHHDRAYGCIVISARVADGLTEFRVSDDGPGIPTEFHQRIFDIFKTLQNRDDREACGVGLAIVKRKVENHGGQIWVESTPLTRGTTFVFTWKEATT